MGLEPTTFRLEVGRAIHCANRAMCLIKGLCARGGLRSHEACRKRS